MKPCATCGLQFEAKRQPYRAEPRFCSITCRVRGTRDERRPKAVQESTRARCAKAAQHAPDTRRCPKCSALFTPTYQHRTQTFCSNRCRIDAARLPGRGIHPERKVERNPKSV